MYDVVVVGAGIVGLATARAVLRACPGARLAVLEKESQPARHQTGRNSGVLHSGVYYRPGSEKARLCVEGKRAMEQFCREHDVPFARCGKVIVAVDDRELPPLSLLHERAQANGVRAEHVDPARLREIEPHAAGIAALYVPDTGIVDFARVAAALGRDLAASGAELKFGHEARRLTEHEGEVVVDTDRGPSRARLVVNCAGLQADLVASSLGEQLDVALVPFRGEYHELVGPAARRVRALVYPVPDVDLPFLGIHLSRGIDGSVHAGPNAVLALAREGYTWRDVDARDLARLFAFPGFWRMARRYWPAAIVELRRSLSRAAVARAASRLVPGIESSDLVPRPAGVRAQVVARDGTLLDDFVVRETPRTVHVLNTPSPAATASLAIGESIAERVQARL